MLEQQVRRMLADRAVGGVRRATSPASGCSCATCRACGPIPCRFPDFDDALRQALRRETELFFDSIVREDRSVARSADAPTTRSSTNGWRGTTASRTSRAATSGASRSPTTTARGLLGQGSILTVTVVSESDVAGAARQVDSREPPRHAAAAAAAERPGAEGDATPAARCCRCGSAWRSTARIRRVRSCHALMDPLGFALENFDAVGRWRTARRVVRADRRVRRPAGRHDVRRRRPGCGRRCSTHPDQFVTTVTEKLLTYALGRGVEYYDAPAVRADRARGGGERLSLLVAHPRHRQQQRPFR